MRLDPSHYLKITNNLIYNSNINHNLKLSIISDIHLSKKVTPQITDYLIYQINLQHPDYICLVGDLIDSPNELKNKDKNKQLTNFLKSLGSIAPTIIALGNHDYIGKNHTYNYPKIYWNKINNLPNIHLLIDDIYQDNNILIMGYFQKLTSYFNPQQPYTEDLEDIYKDLQPRTNLYQNLPTNIPKIALIHSPEFVKSTKIINLLKDYDLLISGHYHQGCMPVILDDIISGHRGIISAKKRLFPKYARGLIPLPTNSKLLITGGITKIQDCAPKLLRPLNHLCYQQMDTVTLTNNSNIYPHQISKQRIYTKNKKESTNF